VDEEYEAKIQLEQHVQTGDLDSVTFVDLLRRRESSLLRKMGEKWTFQDVETLLCYGAGLRGGERYMLNHGLPEAVYPRTYPSGGSMYSVSLYFYARQVSGLEDGWYRYAPIENCLYRLKGAMTDAELDMLLPMTLYKMDVRSQQIEGVALLMFMVADYSYSFKKYGQLAHRLSVFESGHIGQNLQLITTALGKKTLPICGFFPDLVEEALGIRKNKYKHCLYGIIMG
jgi:SagB-type dehydrogenase family enzyme